MRSAPSRSASRASIADLISCPSFSWRDISEIQLSQFIAIVRGFLVIFTPNCLFKGLFNPFPFGQGAGGTNLLEICGQRLNLAALLAQFRTFDLGVKCF